MSALVLHAPHSFVAGRTYIAEEVFSRSLGVQVTIKWEQRETWCLRDSEGARQLVMPDCFFEKADAHWLQHESLPGQPLAVWNISRDLPEARVLHTQVPVIAGRRHQLGEWFVQHSEDSGYLGIDVLGAAFFMLTRYEEMVKDDRDQHGRFPATASLAYEEGFLDRPIVDEYVEALWASMRRLWPGLRRKGHSYDLFLTHDVDRPFSFLQLGRARCLRAAVGDLLKRRSLQTSLRRTATALAPRRLQYRLDPFNSFDWLMEMSEHLGIQSSFFVVAGGASQYDPGYDLDEPELRKLIISVDARGHQLGLHGSYDAMHSPRLLAEQASRLRMILAKHAIHQPTLGGRQHYLRWLPKTWGYWTAAGLDYDSSVGYADSPGFRAGTAREYGAFDLRDRAPLELMERPLVVMEGTLLGRQYQGLGAAGVMTTVEKLSGAVRAMGGTFTILWHNSSAAAPAERLLYQRCLELCV